MARKFLYFIVVCVIVVFAVLLALRLYPAALTRLAFAPKGHFEAQAVLPPNAYQDPGMWFARPGLADDSVRWQPQWAQGAAAPPASEVPPFAVFFVHPTSYLEHDHWNAPLGDKTSQARARIFIKGLASPFGQASEIWAPRYHQAAIGAFLSHSTDARQALDVAYRDVAQAFDEFLARYLAGERARAARSIDISRFLSRRTQEVLQRAGRFALEHGHNELDALHILRVMADEDPAQAAITRRLLLNRCAEEGALLFTGHFGAPHVTAIRSKSDCFHPLFVDGH